jgi:hypothetical protein
MFPLQPPCKQYKCISFPICISKKVIHCDKLLKYFDALHDYLLELDDIDEYPTTEHSWTETCKYITAMFPNLQMIKPYNPYSVGYTLITQQEPDNEAPM